MAPIAREVHKSGIDPLAVAAGRTDGVGERKLPSDALSLPLLAVDDAPPLRRVVADLQESAVHRHIVAVDVQHDDLTRRDPDDRIPSAAAEGVSAGRADAGPALRLQARGG